MHAQPILHCTEPLDWHSYHWHTSVLLFNPSWSVLVRGFQRWQAQLSVPGCQALKQRGCVPKVFCSFITESWNMKQEMGSAAKFKDEGCFPTHIHTWACTRVRTHRQAHTLTHTHTYRGSGYWMGDQLPLVLKHLFIQKSLSGSLSWENYDCARVNIRIFVEEKEMATHSNILAWKSPWTEEPGGLQSMGLHDWACVHEGGGRWVGSKKVVELKNKRKRKKNIHWKIMIVRNWK